MGVGVREDARFLGRDFGDHRTDVLKRPREPLEACQVEPAQDAEDDVVADDLDVGEDLATPVADPDQDHPAILRMPDALDEPMLLHPVDEARGVRVRDAQELGDAAHGQLAVAVEHGHEVQVRHRDAVAEEPFAADAAQFAQRRAKLGDDPFNERGALGVEPSSS